MKRTWALEQDYCPLILGSDLYWLLTTVETWEPSGCLWPSRLFLKRMPYESGFSVNIRPPFLLLEKV